MRDQKVMRAGMRNKEFILCGLSIGKFVYSTLARENPTVFWEWFTYSHLILKPERAYKRN